MALLDPLYRICKKPIFNSRRKMPIHILQVVLIIIAVGLSAPRLFIKNPRPTRAATMALAIGAKSLVFLAYMILTETTTSFKRWHSYKANVVLSCIDVVFWAAVPGLLVMAVIKECTGVTCGLSWGVIVVGLIIQMSIVFTSAIAIREYREYKHGGTEQGHVEILPLPTRHQPSHHHAEMLGQVTTEPKATYSYNQRKEVSAGHNEIRQHHSEHENVRNNCPGSQERLSGYSHHYRHSERRH